MSLKKDNLSVFGNVFWKQVLDGHRMGFCETVA